MGTLFNQTPRMSRLEDSRIITIGGSIKTIAKELDISFDDALNLYLAVAKIDDYDTRDEQLAGLGELLEGLVAELDEIKSEFGEK